MKTPSGPCSVLFLGIMFFGFASVPAAALADFHPLWVTDAATYTEAGPTVADIDNDGVCEVVLAGREEIIALDGAGKILWRTKGHVRFMTVPTVLPRPGQPALIYAADMGGFMMCVDGMGKVVWDVKLNGPATWMVASLTEIEGRTVVVQGDESGTISALDALTGETLGTAKVTGKPSSPAVGDIDMDGTPEAVVITDLGNVSAVDSSGATRWETNIGGTSQTWGTAAPVMFKTASGQVRIAAASNDNLAVCLDNQGRILWRHAVRGPVAATLSVGDMGNDGIADVFLITQLGVIYRFEEDGSLKWEIDMQGRSLAAGALVDFDGNGRQEYVFCTQDGHLMVLDQVGGFVADYQFPHRTINVTPAFGEIDPKTPGLEMAITGGEAGLVYAFPTDVPNDTPPSPWNGYRGNPRKTGAWFGLLDTDLLQMAPENLPDNGFLAEDTIRFRISSPSGAATPLKAEAWCIRPDNSRLSASTCIVGRTGLLELPVRTSIVPGRYLVECSLREAGDGAKFSGQFDVHIQPFRNDRVLQGNALRVLESAAQAVQHLLPRSANALREEARELAQLRDVAIVAQEAAASGQEAEDRAIELTSTANERAKRAKSIADAVQQAGALGAGTSLLAFETGLWDSRNVDAQIPEKAHDHLRIERRLTLGEHESVSLGLFNILDTPLQVRVVVAPDPQGPQVTLLHSQEVPTSQGDRSWDALPELDESGVVTIPPLTTVEVWAAIATNGVPAGDHTVKIKALALTGAGVLDGPKSPQNAVPKETNIEIALHILPFEMAPSGAVRLCAWASYDDGAVRDLLEHGNNVFLAPNGVPQYDATGVLTGVDFKDLDKRIEPLRGHDVVVLLNGLPSVPGELGSPEYEQKFAPFVQATVAHLAEQGFDTDHFAFYPIDEPGGFGWEHVNKMVAFGKMLRAANPKAMLYVDGGGELPMFEAMAPYMDIWCPGISMLAENSKTMDVVRHSGRMLWSYDCGYAYSRPVGPNIKNINIPAQFLTAPIFTFRHNATGLGYWCYNIGDSLWGRTQFEYPLVYPGRTKPVSSRRWEAVREGLEDFRILTALRNQAKDTTVDAATRERIRVLLEVRLPALIDKSFEEAKRGLARYVLDAGMNEALYNGLRKEIMDCAEALRP